jgi:EAL domain-containing protein (putative c-di-GMP-specific phosphodiesterase class I)
VLEALRDRGARLSLDDFGTGYSSLSYLKRFPLDTLKIDRSFISELDAARDTAALVATIVSMARTLDLDVVAEGVETEEQLRRLRELGCDRAQGFLLARPLPPADLHADGVIWGASLLPARATNLI